MRDLYLENSRSRCFVKFVLYIVGNKDPSSSDVLLTSGFGCASGAHPGPGPFGLPLLPLAHDGKDDLDGDEHDDDPLEAAAVLVAQGVAQYAGDLLGVVHALVEGADA